MLIFSVVIFVFSTLTLSPRPPLPRKVGGGSWPRAPMGAPPLPARSGAEPQPKSNLVHFSLKIRHLVATILMMLVKSQMTEKQVVYIVKTIFTIMEVSLLSPGNINIWEVTVTYRAISDYFLKLNVAFFSHWLLEAHIPLHCHPEYWWGNSHWCPHQTKYWWGYVPSIPGGVVACVANKFSYLFGRCRRLHSVMLSYSSNKTV